jgi:hypothetical protein
MYGTSVFYVVFVWAHRALKHQKRLFPARAVFPADHRTGNIDRQVSLTARTAHRQAR